MTKRYAASLVLLVLAGWVVGEFAVVTSRRTERSPIEVGDTLNILADPVYGAHGEVVKLRTQVPAKGTTVLAVFNPRCASCVPEAVGWNRLASLPGVAVIAIGVTPDLQFVSEFMTRTRAKFSVWRSDVGIPKKLRLRAMPAVIIARSGRVVFYTEGPGGAESAARWLSTTP